MALKLTNLNAVLLHDRQVPPNWRLATSLDGGKSNVAVAGCVLPITGIRGTTLKFLIQALTAREVRIMYDSCISDLCKVWQCAEDS